MNATGATRDLLHRTPDWLPDGGVLSLVREDAGVIVSCGDGPVPELRWQDGQPVAQPGAASAAGATAPIAQARVALPDGRDHLLAVWPAGTLPDEELVIRDLLRIWAVVERVEQDLESVISSSTGLLEEVAMLNETLPELAALDGEEKLAALCVENLMIATGTSRGLYVALSATNDEGELQAHFVRSEAGITDLLADRAGTAGDGAPWAIDPTRGVLARALKASKAVIVHREDFGAPAEPATAPEWLAAREVLAVPVVADLSGGAQSFGVLLVMDKAPDKGSKQASLGSPEASITSAVASVLAAFLGARRNAESRKEIALATEIQHQILPDGPPRVAGFELAGSSTAHGSMGGDYYDYLELGDGRTLVAIADVSGHNLASGIVMVSTRAALRAIARESASPAAVFTALGHTLHGDLSDLERFVTAAAVAIRPDSPALELVNAGHNPVMWFRKELDEVELLEAEDPIFGFMPGLAYSSSPLEAAPGDVVLLYTDGVTEAANEAGEMFGEERLAAILKGHAGAPAAGILAAVLAGVDAFADNRGAGGDDVTVVVLRIT